MFKCPICGKFMGALKKSHAISTHFLKHTIEFVNQNSKVLASQVAWHMSCDQMNLLGQCSNTAWNENLSTIKNEDRLLVKIFLKCIINYIYKVAIVEVIFVLIKEFTHNFHVDFFIHFILHVLFYYSTNSSITTESV